MEESVPIENMAESQAAAGTGRASFWGPTLEPCCQYTLREIGTDEVARLEGCLEALAAHHNQVSVHFKGCYPKTPHDETIARFRREVADGTSSIAVAETGGAIVGFCKVDLCGRLGTLDYLVVLSEHRGRGLGDRLMEWALARLMDAGVEDIDVKVADGNGAVTFYERFGFRPNAHIYRLSRPWCDR